MCLVKFISDRKVLGLDNNKYSLSKEDKKTIDNLYKTLPTPNIKFTKNKRKPKRNKKRKVLHLPKQVWRPL